MPFNIAQWKEGDDPQLVIDFINEVMDDIRPSYSQLGWFTAEQEAEIQVTSLFSDALGVWSPQVNRR